MPHSKRELVRLALHGSKTELPDLPKGELFIDESFLDRFYPRGLSSLSKLKSFGESLDLDLLGVPIEYLETKWPEKDFDPNEFYTVVVFSGVFSFWQKTFGFFETLKAIGKKEERLKDARTFYLNEISKKIQLLHDFGFSAFAVADDLAGEKGPLISPEHFESLLLPFYREIVYQVKSEGFAVFFHSCGKLGKIFESICQLGIDCIYACDHITDPAHLELKEKKWGVSLMGFIDFARWDEKKISEEIERLKKIFPFGGLILGSTSGLFDGISLDHLSLLYPRLKESYICQIQR